MFELSVQGKCTFGQTIAKTRARHIPRKSVDILLGPRARGSTRIQSKFPVGLTGNQTTSLGRVGFASK